MKNFSSFMLNSLVLLVVFLVAFSVSSLALARKINSYRDNPGNPELTISKEEVVITTSVPGRIEQVYFNQGQHVDKGDLILELKDDTFESRIAVLEQVSDENLSASTEAELLKAQANYYKIFAPRAGIIKEIETAQGSVIPTNTRVVTIQADTGVHLVTRMNTVEFERVQRLTALEVFSERLEQSYTITFVGVGEVENVYGQGNTYEILYQFSDPNEGAAFLEGETLEVIAGHSEALERPGELVADLWNSLIIGR